MRYLFVLGLVLTAGCVDVETGANLSDAIGSLSEANVLDVTIALNGTYNPIFVLSDFTFGPNFTVANGTTLRLTFVNNDSGGSSHNVCLRDVANGCTDNVPSGQNVTTEFLIELPLGDHEFFCDIGNHRQQGMRGTFTVV